MRVVTVQLLTEFKQLVDTYNNIIVKILPVINPLTEAQQDCKNLAAIKLWGLQEIFESWLGDFDENSHTAECFDLLMRALAEARIALTQYIDELGNCAWVEPSQLKSYQEAMQQKHQKFETAILLTMEKPADHTVSNFTPFSAKEYFAVGFYQACTYLLNALEFRLTKGNESVEYEQETLKSLNEVMPFVFSENLLFFSDIKRISQFLFPLFFGTLEAPARPCAELGKKIVHAYQEAYKVHSKFFPDGSYGKRWPQTGPATEITEVIVSEDYLPVSNLLQQKVNDRKKNWITPIYRNSLLSTRGEN